jgi:hypothetical protein
MNGLRRMAFMLLLVAAQTAYAGRIDIVDTRVWLQDETYLLDADLSYEPDEKVMEALGNGIPVVFRISFAVEEEGLFAHELASGEIDYMVRFRPLAAFYEVTDSHGNRHTFVSRVALFAYLGELREIPLVRTADLETGKEYRYLVKAELDIDSLPLPMRPMAWFSPVWKLSSGWREWPLNP